MILTSEQLFDFPAGCGGGELVDDVQGCLVVSVTHVHVDARLHRQTQSAGVLEEHALPQNASTLLKNNKLRQKLVFSPVFNEPVASNTSNNKAYMYCIVP